MMSGLVLQLMQSVVQLPEAEEESAVADEDLDEDELRRRRKRKVDNDVFIEQSYTQALQVAHNFLARFMETLNAVIVLFCWLVLLEPKTLPFYSLDGFAHGL